MALELNLLGPVTARVAGVPIRIGSRKNIALLAYLVRRGGAVPRESVMALLWPDSGDEQARASLRQALAVLRRDLGSAGAAVLSGEDHALALADGAVLADCARFERLAGSETMDDMVAGEALWRGVFLEGVGPVTPEFDRWAEAERGALRARFEALLLRICDAMATAGRTEEMIATALRLLALDPLQEHVHRRVIEGYRRQQRFDAALRQFESLRAVLRDELGVSPEPATLELVREVRKARANTGPAQGEPDSARPGPAPQTPSARPSIAVLPFVGLPEGSDAALLGEGIAEEVLVNLSRDRGLLVVSRQSSFHAQMASAPPQAIGEQLGVRFLLSGSVRSTGQRIRVVAHLARCTDGAGLWSETYDRDIGDIFALQSEIARTVMATAMGRILEEETEGAGQPGGNIDAWRFVLLGLRQLHAHTPETMRAAIDALQKAVALAPENGRAQGLLALARIYDRWNYAGQSDVQDILPLAERALTLDCRDSRAHCAMGLGCLLTRDFDRAGRHFEAGLAVNPNDDLLLIEYGRYLFYVDRPEDGLRRIREAMRLNPLHPDWFWNVQGRCLHLLGRHAEALDAFRRILRPVFYHFAYMASCHHALGETAEAEAMKRQLFAARPDFDLRAFVETLPHRNPESAARFARELDWLDQGG